MIKKKFLLANSGSHWGNWSKLNHAQIGVLNHELKIIDRKFVPMAQCVIVTSELLAQRTYSSSHSNTKNFLESYLQRILSGKPVMLSNV